MIRTAVLLAASFVLSACGSAPTPYYGTGATPTFADADDAFEWSAANNHLVAVFFTSGSCAACWTFENDVLSEALPASGGDVALVRVDFPGIASGSVSEYFADRERRALSEEYRGGRKGLPDVVLVDPVTRVAVTNTSAPDDPGAFAVFLEQAHELAGTRR